MKYKRGSSYFYLSKTVLQCVTKLELDQVSKASKYIAMYRQIGGFRIPVTETYDAFQNPIVSTVKSKYRSGEFNIYTFV